MKNKILIATTNPSKFKEAVSVLEASADWQIEILNLKDFPDIKQIEETGETFEENAILKAKGYYEQIKIPTIADDGGLIVDYLGGMPGVHSHRWLGPDANEADFAQIILEKLKDVPIKQRTACLGGVIVYWDGKNLIKKENWIHGYISDKLIGELKPGFPYRPILMIPEFNKAYSELTEEEHEQVNFRRKNFKALKEEILKL